MKLFLCEKPSQGRDIAKVLGAGQKGDGCLQGGGVVVTWCFGHLMETAPPEAYGEQYKRWTLEALPILPGAWKMEVKQSARKQFKVVKDLLSKASAVVIATDADREGETIAREVLEVCRWQGPVSRLWLSALDDASIRKALGNILPGQQTWPLYQAGLARSRADWLVGMNLTRMFTLLGKASGHQGVLSVGRVQTPTLRLVVDRDREIEAFIPKPFWEVLARMQDPVSQTQFTARWMPHESISDEEGRCLDQNIARQLTAALAGQVGRVRQAETKRVKESQPLLFDLGGLQQECSRRWGFGAQQVLDIAQSLYENHKATTYPRTDCGYLPASMLAEVGQVMQALVQTDSNMQPWVAGADLQQQSRAWNDSKITAHHGIIPTKAAFDLGKLSDAELKVYDLIRRRYLAQFYPRHEFDQTTAYLDIVGQLFKATGKRIQVPGWKALFGVEKSEDDAEDDQLLPVLAEGIEYPVVNAQCADRQTKPPARFTEGTLIAAMKNAARYVQDPRLKQMLKETAGLGTEATRAAIIETLMQRGFLVKQKKHLISSAAARGLIDALPSAVKDPGMTALWEQALDEIAQGQRTLDDFMGRQTHWVGQMIGKLQQQGGVTLEMPAAEQKTCPACGKPMRQIKGKKGAFWGCTGYPECKATVDGGGKRKTVSRRKPAKI